MKRLIIAVATAILLFAGASPAQHTRHSQRTRHSAGSAHSGHSHGRSHSGHHASHRRSSK